MQQDSACLFIRQIIGQQSLNDLNALISGEDPSTLREFVANLIPTYRITSRRAEELLDDVQSGASTVEAATDEWQLFIAEFRGRWRLTYSIIMIDRFIRFAITQCGSVNSLAEDLLHAELNHLQRDLAHVANAATQRWEAGLQQLVDVQIQQQQYGSLDQLFDRTVCEHLETPGQPSRFDASAAITAITEGLNAHVTRVTFEAQQQQDAVPLMSHVEASAALLPDDLPSWLCSGTARTTLEV